MARFVRYLNVPLAFVALLAAAAPVHAGPWETAKIEEAERLDAALSNLPSQPKDVHRPKIAEARKIALERMVEATETFSKGMVFVQRGGRYDVDDEIVRLEPGLFRRMDGTPLPPKKAA